MEEKFQQEQVSDKMKKNKKLEKEKSFKKILKNKTFWAIFFLVSFLLFPFVLLQRAGILGRILAKISFFLFGKATYFVFIIFFLESLSLFFSKVERAHSKSILALIFSIIGISGFLEEGFVGKILSTIFFKLLGSPLTKISFTISFLISFFLFWELVREKESKEKITLLRKIFAPKFEILPLEKSPIQVKEKQLKEIKVQTKKSKFFEYKTPPLELLEQEKEIVRPLDLEKNAQIIKKTLENFGIEVQLGPINVGPTVTQYTLKPAEGVRLAKISALSKELSLALAAHPIRIEAPIPGKGLVGVEVPNKIRNRVRLRNLISHPDFQKHSSNLLICLGKDVTGQAQFADVEKMPHLLVAGATGSGKTIFLNTIILSLVYRNPPSILRFLLIDPKRIEFHRYENLPHVISPVICEVKEALKAFSWLIEEMETRFQELAEKRVRDIFEYNKLSQKEKFSPLPFILLIVDELADLMIQKGREIEGKIVKLAQKSRAVGIHLVLATQRPSVDVITGLIKANITSRVAFQLPSQIDSRTVLDTSGAEKLLGMGDMLFISAEISKPKRIQAPFVSKEEVERVVNWIKESFQRKEEDYLSESFQEYLKEETEEETIFTFEGEDPLYEKAKTIVIQAGKASASLLQRRLKIGYARAARLLDMLEERGIIGPARGAKPREVYGTLKDIEEEIENEEI